MAIRDNPFRGTEEGTNPDTFGHSRVFTFGTDEELVWAFGSLEQAEAE